MLSLIMTRATLTGSNERERERERDMGVCFFLLFIFMEFTTQGGSTPEYRHSALLHTNPKRIKVDLQKPGTLHPQAGALFRLAARFRRRTLSYDARGRRGVWLSRPITAELEARWWKWKVSEIAEAPYFRVTKRLPSIAHYGL
jgi:hypothetical protein